MLFLIEKEMSRFYTEKESSLVSPRKVIAPKQFSNYIQQAHHLQINSVIPSTSSIPSSAPSNRATVTSLSSIKSPKAKASPRNLNASTMSLNSPKVATMDILFPAQKQIVSKLAQPKSSKNGRKEESSPTSLSSTVSQQQSKKKSFKMSTKSSNSLPCSSASSCQSSQISSTTPRKRESVEELESLLIEQTKILRKLQIENEQNQKLYAKTKEQLELKQEENNQTTKELFNHLLEMRKSLKEAENMI